ncbi:uncharacterized protein LOC129207872 [Grus americana]|uniref:uncharacterized protein LOC129207872 n=1 Tax=Grus americana TaxID=9117 RepID=UPI00240780FB|nr:uncharacterized protein LOC129207872 [Grus americana]
MVPSASPCGTLQSSSRSMPTLAHTTQLKGLRCNVFVGKSLETAANGDPAVIASTASLGLGPFTRCLMGAITAFCVMSRICQQCPIKIRLFPQPRSQSRLLSQPRCLLFTKLAGIGSGTLLLNLPERHRWGVTKQITLWKLERVSGRGRSTLVQYSPWKMDRSGRQLKRGTVVACEELPQLHPCALGQHIWADVHGTELGCTHSSTAAESLCAWWKEQPSAGAEAGRSLHRLHHQCVHGRSLT